MAQIMKDVVTWLQQWFYTESEIDTKLSNKANKNLTTANMNVVTDSSGDITVEAKPTIPSASSTTPSADVSGGAIGSGTTWAKADHQHPLSSAYATASHSQATTTITNSETYSNLGSNLTNQKLINDAINTKIGELVGIDFITVVTTLPTASADTMGKIYLVAITGSSDNNFKEYVTVRSGTSPNYTYAWEKLGEISGSGLSVDWSDITNKPSSFTPSSHTHGSVTNDGKIGSDSGKIITTGTGGVLQASASITKSLISDFPSTMTPSSHTHGQITNDGKITSTAVTVASGDNIVITDASDSSIVKRVANLLASHITDSNAHSNIGSSANDSQATINSDIDTALSNKISKSNTSGLVKNDGSIDTTSYVSDVSGKADKTSVLGTTITLVNKGETNEGCIIFETIS